METAYDEVKTHILGPGVVLRSKTPDLVCQEIDEFMLAHYAVRCLIHEAADKAGEDPDRISFVLSVKGAASKKARRRAWTRTGPWDALGVIA